MKTLSIFLKRSVLLLALLGCFSMTLTACAGKPGDPGSDHASE
jgi:hypothetical protein